MNIVLDTNILLVSISPRSKFYPIFRAFEEEQDSLCVTTDILIEYEEILRRHVDKVLTTVILQIIENAPNTKLVSRYYKWNLIPNDPDDNKFVDCAVAGNAKYIVSHDKHFNHLRTVKFPKITVVGAEAFMHEIIDPNV